MVSRVFNSDAFDSIRGRSTIAANIISERSNAAPRVVLLTLILDYHPLIHAGRVGSILSRHVDRYQIELRHLFGGIVRGRVAYRNGGRPLFARLRSGSRYDAPSINSRISS